MTDKAVAANRANGELGGRPAAAITEEQREEIYEAVRAGVPPEAAAGRIGVSRPTLYRWMAAGRGDDAQEPYRTFLERVDRALSDWETRDILLIGKAAETQWQAAAWRLERRLRDRYGRATKIEGNITVTARPFIDVAKLTLAEQRQLRELLEKAQPSDEDLPPEARPALELMPGDPVAA